MSLAPLFRFNLQFHGAESGPGWVHCSGLSSFSGALLLLSGRGRPQDLGTRGTTSSEGVKKSKLNGSDSLWKNSYRQLGGFDMASSPPQSALWPPCLAHAPAALRRAFTGREIIAGRGAVDPSSMQSCENPLMRERASIQAPLFNTFLWENIGHYEVSRFTWDSIEGYNPFKQQTNKSLNPLFSYLLAG